MVHLYGSNPATGRERGFSLIELMVAVAVIGIVSAIAIPIYTDYLATAEQGVVSNNIESLRLFEEDLKLSDGAYVSGTYDPDNPDAAGGLKKQLGWFPNTEQDTIHYEVKNVTSSGFTVVAKDNATNEVIVTKTYP